MPVFQTEVVSESDVLIVSFSGLLGRFIPFEFSKTTQTLSYNRIHVRDPYKLFYLAGVDENGFDHLRERLRAEMSRFNVKKVIFIGASSGGFAALLFGHLLGADCIHAFAPRIHLQLTKMVAEGDYKSVLNRLLTVWKLHRRLSVEHRQFLDLKPLLNSDKPRTTRTYLHACASCIDAVRVRYVHDCPNTRLFFYPCSEHNVAKVLVQSNYIQAMLQRQNLDAPEKIYRKFYGNFDQPSFHSPIPAGG